MNGHKSPVLLARGFIWFVAYLSWYVVVGGAIFYLLTQIAGGPDKLFQIPFVHTIFKVCPLVFLAMAGHAARRKVLGDSIETSFLSSETRGAESKSKFGGWIKKSVVHLRLFWLQFLALAFLALAFVKWEEYSVFTLIRFFACATFVRLSWGANRVGNASWVWIWGVMAAAYNPFVPLSLGREVWVWVNLATIGVILFDVIRLSPSRSKAFKCVSKLTVCLLLLWGAFVGGKHYFSEVLPKQQAKEAAKKKELEEQESERKRAELDALMREVDPSWGASSLLPIGGLLPDMDYSDKPSPTTEEQEKSWAEEERKKREDEN